MAKVAKRRAVKRPATSKPKTTRSGGTTTSTRKRTSRAFGGPRSVTTSRSRTKAGFGRPKPKRTSTRTGTVNTKGGLKRTAKMTKRVTGSGANRVVKKTRVITRVRNGRTVKRVVNFVTKNGKTTRTAAKPKVTGGTKRLTPATHKPMAVKKVTNPGVSHHQQLGGNGSPRGNGGTTAPARKTPTAPKRRRKAR